MDEGTSFGQGPNAPACAHARQTLLHLLEVETDAVAGYEAAASRLCDASLQREVRKLKQDHQRHVEELSRYVEGVGPLSAAVSQEHRLLLAGRMRVAQVVGDEAVLQTLATLEHASNEAYEAALGDDSLLPTTLEVVQRNFLDERKHQHWLKRTLHAVVAPEGPADAGEAAAVSTVAAAGLDTAGQRAQAGRQVGDFRPPQR